MSDKIETNPNDSVYPQIINSETNGLQYSEGGLTKREYFAAMAMQGTLANPEGMEYLSKRYGNHDFPSAFASIAAKSVQLADALITELNKP